MKEPRPSAIRETIIRWLQHFILILQPSTHKITPQLSSSFKITSHFQRLILRDLLVSSGGLHIFTIHRRYGVSPAALNDALDELLQTRIVELAREKIILTPVGIEFMGKVKGDFFRTSEKSWRRVPDRFIDSRMLVNNPYIPRIQLLDQETFPFVKRRRGENIGGL